MSGLDRFPKKTCKFCQDPKPNHFPYACPANPKVMLKRKIGMKRTPLNKIGKQTKQWIITRATWIRKNPPDKDGYWYCYLRIHPWCTPKLVIDKDKTGYGIGLLTVDHVVARSRDGSKKFSQDNLQPACGYCNDMKGSRSLDEVKPKPVL